MGCGASSKPTPTKYVEDSRARDPRIKRVCSGYFVRKHPEVEELSEHYRIDEELTKQHAGFGHILVASDIVSNATVAVKPVNKELRDKTDIDAEIALLRKVSHPHIINLRALCQDAVNFYMIFDFCEGGQLLEAVASMERIPERATALIVLHISSGLTFLHKHNFCHRGIQPSAILLQSKVSRYENMRCILTDFRKACRFKPGKKMTENVGNKDGFSSPEMIHDGEYTEKCDTYSFGAVLCTMYFGSPPEPVSEEDEQTGVSEWKAVLPEDASIKVGSKPRQLIQQCLMGERKRPDQADIMFQDWVSDANLPEGATDDLTIKQLNNMKVFCQSNKLKKLAIHAAAVHLSTVEVEKLARQFEVLDRDHSGYVSVSELAKSVQSLSSRASYRNSQSIPADMKELVELMDVNGTRNLSFREFMAAAMDRRHYEIQAACAATFEMFDKDGNGKISKQEIKQVLASEKSVAAEGDAMCKTNSITEVLEHGDGDGDDHIDFEEFTKMMKDTACSDIMVLCNGRKKGSSAPSFQQDKWAYGG